MKLFELFATLSLDTSEFEESVDDAKEKASGLGDTMQKGVTAKTVAMGNAIYDAAKAAAGMLWSLGQDAISAAAEIEAENAQFAATFKGLETEAAAAFGSVSEDTNILAGRLRAVGMQAFSQFKGAGMDATRALSSMDEYMRLAADAAAYYDISLEDADTRMRSFLRGNVEAGDAIGLFTSALQRDEKGLELYNAKWQDLNEEQRQLVMLDIAKQIYTQSGALGQAAREGDAYANVVGNFQRAWKEALATLGGPILQKITPAIQKLTDFLQENPETLEKIGNVFGDLAGIAIDGLIGGLEWMSEHGDEVLETFNNVLATINNIIAAVSSFLGLDADKEVTITTYYENVTSDQSGTGGRSSTYLGGGGGWGVSDVISFFAGSGSTYAEGRAVGLDYVPYNDYLANLHEGEAVLTKSEATEWRRGGNGMDLSQIGPIVAAAVREGMQGVSVHMSGEKVGDLVTDRVSRNMAQAAWEERYSV